MLSKACGVLKDLVGLWLIAGIGQTGECGRLVSLQLVFPESSCSLSRGGLEMLNELVELEASHGQTCLATVDTLDLVEESREAPAVVCGVVSRPDEVSSAATVNDGISAKRFAIGSHNCFFLGEISFHRVIFRNPLNRTRGQDNLQRLHVLREHDTSAVDGVSIHHLLPCSLETSNVDIAGKLERVLHHVRPGQPGGDGDQAFLEWCAGVDVLNVVGKDAACGRNVLYKPCDRGGVTHELERLNVACDKPVIHKFDEFLHVFEDGRTKNIGHAEREARVSHGG